MLVDLSCKQLNLCGHDAMFNKVSTLDKWRAWKLMGWGQFDGFVFQRKWSNFKGVALKSCRSLRSFYFLGDFFTITVLSKEYIGGKDLLFFFFINNNLSNQSVVAIFGSLFYSSDSQILRALFWQHVFQPHPLSSYHLTSTLVAPPFFFFLAVKQMNTFQLCSFVCPPCFSWSKQ